MWSPGDHWPRGVWYGKMLFLLVLGWNGVRVLGCERREAIDHAVSQAVTVRLEGVLKDYSPTLVIDQRRSSAMFFSTMSRFFV